MIRVEKFTQFLWYKVRANNKSILQMTIPAQFDAKTKINGMPTGWKIITFTLSQIIGHLTQLSYHHQM
jgi:hypothetical protein